MEMKFILGAIIVIIAIIFFLIILMGFWNPLTGGIDLVKGLLRG